MSTTLLDIPGSGVADDTTGQSYSHYTYTYTATLEQTYLTFQFRQDPAYWGLDDISVKNSAGTEQLANGGFETGTFSGWTTIGATGNTAAGVVRAGTPGADPTHTHSGSYTYYDGVVGGVDGIFQSFKTTVGETYTVSFWLANDGGGPSLAHAEIGDKNASYASYASSPSSIGLASGGTSLAADHIVTSQTAPTIVGLADAGSTVTVTVDGNSIGTTVAGSDGRWSLTAPTSLSDANHVISASAQISGGTASPATNVTLTVDTAAPAAPSAPTLAPASDTGLVGDHVTKIALPTFTGTAEAGSIVHLYDGATLIGTAIANATTGAYAITATTALHEGANALTVTATDIAGNVSAASPVLSVELDTAAPAAPAAPTLAPASDTGVAGDGITTVTTPIVTGTTEAGATVRLYDTDGVTLLGTTTAASDGTYSITSAILGEGNHTLTVKASDAAGNASPASGSLVVHIDTAAPAVAADVSSPAIQGGFINAASNAAGQALTGTAEAGSTVTIYDGTTPLGTVTADPTDGHWSYTLGGLSDGHHSLTTTVTDTAGNTGVPSTAVAFDVDTQAPDAPAVKLQHAGVLTAVGGFVKDAAIDIAPGEAGGTLSYRVDGVAVSSYDPASLAQGSHTVEVTHTDAAGNTSLAASLNFVLDSVAPDAKAGVVTGSGLSSAYTGNLLSKVADASPVHLDSLQFADGPTVTVPQSGTVAVVGAHGTLTVSADGSYSYHGTSAGHDVFTETVVDAAGNATQTSLAFDIDHAHDGVMRFLDTATGAHIFTTSAAEATQVEASLPSYHVEALQWSAPDQGTDTVDVFRFFNASTGDHMFTTSATERDSILKELPSYHYEGVGFQAYASEGGSGTETLERFYNAQTGQHHYALADEAAGMRQGAAGMGWVDEGKAFVVSVPHDHAA